MEAVVDGLRAVDAVDVSLISSYQSPENSRLSPCVNGACTGKERRKIHVRLLLSIDRRETTASAMETVCRRNMIHKTLSILVSEMLLYGYSYGFRRQDILQMNIPL